MTSRSARKALLALVLAALTLAAGAARADSPRSHEDGFFLRLSAGGGTGSAEAKYAGTKYEFSGSTADLNFAIGAVVSPNFAIHGTLFGWLASDADYEVNGVATGEEFEVDMSAIGVGFTYYFMPANLYFSSSIGSGSLTFENDQKLETDSGIALDFTLGKEWWVGDSWGLGAAASFGYHTIPDGSPGIDENWTGTSFSIRFTATMN